MCARVALPTLLGGPSASPLDGTVAESRNSPLGVPPMKLRLIIPIAAVLISLNADPARCDEPEVRDIGMLLMNSPGPFVTRDFADHLAHLVIAEKYQGAVVADEPGQVLDKGDARWVTVKVQRWLSPPAVVDSPLTPTQLTICIQKRNAAIGSSR